MTSNAVRPSGNLRTRGDSDGITLSWPMWTTYMRAQAAAQQRVFRIMFWIMAAFLFGVAMSLQWMIFRNWNDGDSLADAATWQGRLGFPIIIMGLTLMIVELAVWMLWFLHGRIYLSIQPTRLSAFVKVFSGGYRCKFDPRSSRLAFDTMGGSRHLALADGARSVRIGMGLPECDLNEIARVVAKVTGLKPTEVADPPPVRFQIIESPHAAAIQIHRLGRPLPHSIVRSILVLLGPFIITLMVGIGLTEWASRHDPVMAARRVNAQARLARESNDDVTWEKGLMTVCMVGGMIFGTFSIRRIWAKSSIELSGSSAIVDTRGRRVVIPRNEIEALVIGRSQIGNEEMRKLTMTRASRTISIHPYLSPEEADWLVKWIRSRWPEVQVKEV